MDHFNITKSFIQIIFNVLLISLFLTTFFFTYVKNIENNIFINNIKYLVDDLSSTIKLFGPRIGPLINQSINDINMPDLSHEDNNTIENNNNIFKNAVIANVIFTFIILLIIYHIYTFYDNSICLKNIVIQNFIILLFIIFTEYSLLTYFISEYIAVDPNKVKITIVNNIK